MSSNLSPRDPALICFSRAMAIIISSYISKIESVVEGISSARQGLHWQGGSERYFQWQVGRRISYLGQNNGYLETLRSLMKQAEQAGSITPPRLHPLGGAS